MRNDCRVVEEKWLLPVLLNELNGCFVNGVGGINTFPAAVVLMKKYLLAVMPQLFGVVVMGKRLAVESVEFIKPLFAGIA